ncbi:MAG TPA: helix-turn-helix domain-containing protein [Thermoanaerobaculales bacterium]|nr:helix-turn-helix domain-containing protein [Thermoanaerobaculales bacterium]HPA79672.1 helix-turn-helix domain-containing protein [Thermoanaerobaculales bacterium]HQL28959.1 helix-turn-helix domain-containing protein [Thermoanaerobaculales bacterium]HQN95031.1 helix-turn-helix domain-containing protein [Thermoanaerobaculales bacterium]HQP43184.1 helix-turn-helix domain-containing protein [Thermoanaerobaculales bacterium]
MPRDTRDRILDAASRLFSERGFDGTAVADVLAGAGVRSGSLYHFFPSKEALAEAVVARCADRAREALLDPAEAAATDPLERVFALLGRWRLGLEGRLPGGPDPSGLLAAELAARRPGVGRLAEGYRARLAARIRSWLDDAGPRLPADVDRAELASFVVTVLEGATMQSRAAASLEPFDRAVRQLRALLALLEGAPATARAAGARELAEPAAPGGAAGDPAGWRAW